MSPPTLDYAKPPRSSRGRRGLGVRQALMVAALMNGPMIAIELYDRGTIAGIVGLLINPFVNLVALYGAISFGNTSSRWRRDRSRDILATIAIFLLAGFITLTIAFGVTTLPGC